MNNSLLNSDDLKEWTGYQSDAALRRWMDEIPPIPYKISPKGGICTTLEQINEALRRGKAMPVHSVHAEAWEV